MDKTNAFKRLIDQFPLGTAALAAAMVMSPTTLRHKANPLDSRQSFSPEEGIRLQQLAREYGPLHVEAEALGFMVLARPAELTSDEAAQLLNSTVREFGQYLTEATTALADNRITANELARVDDECLSAIAALQALRAHIAQLHEAGKPQSERGARA